MEKLTSDEQEYYSLVEKAFESLAPFYDAVTLPISQTRNITVDFAGADTGSKILDVATGTGSQALAFAKRGYEVTGIDLTEAMLRVAKKKNQYLNLKFEIGDATDLRFGANSFDVACISFALHDMLPSIRERTLREMVRVVKPGGLIIIVDYSLPVHQVGRFLIYHLISLYESDFYRDFIHSNFAELLPRLGIEIIDELTILLSAGKIWKAIK